MPATDKTTKAVRPIKKPAPPVLSPISLLTPTEAAAILAVGRTKLLSLVRDGRVRCRMLDGRIRIPIEALQEFRDSLPQGYVPGKAVAS
jgi:excisionase family DNA binding protein